MYSCRNYDVIESAIFLVSKVKKANDIPNTDWNKLKRTFTTFW